MNAIEKKLGYAFRNVQLLENALVHKSSLLGKGETLGENNERLEFLGDAVLNLIISTYLYKKWPHLDEGILTQWREQIVDAKSLVEYTQKLQIEEHCLVGKNEKKGLQENSILADLFEAILGAIYLDGGLPAAEEFFFQHFLQQIMEKVASPRRNWKKELQEMVQKVLKDLPKYELIEEVGPHHRKSFRVVVKIQGKIAGEGIGWSKKEAEMMAAKDAIEKRGNGEH